MLKRAARPETAPRLLRARANAIDAAVMVLPAAVPSLLALRRRAGGRPRPDGGRAEWVAPARRVAALLGERYGSPGERIAGVRTVDSRSGRPVPLPRTAALAALAVGGDVLGARLRRVGKASQQKRNASWAQMHEELVALEAEHRDDPDALNLERMRLYQRHRVETPGLGVTLARPLIIGLCFSLLQNRLRRRFAPTAVVVWDWSR